MAQGTAFFGEWVLKSLEKAWRSSVSHKCSHTNGRGVFPFPLLLLEKSGMLTMMENLFNHTCR